MASNAFTKRQSWSRPARIGFLGATTPKVWSAFVEAFEDELSSLGWVKGDNLEIDYRWAHGEPGNYRSIARGFVKDGVDIIVTSGTAPVRAAMQATSEIPIVFAAAGAPAKTGLKRKNVTGLSNRQPDLAARRIGLLRRLVPKLKRLAYLGNPRVKNSTLEAKQIGKHFGNSYSSKVIRCNVTSASQITSKINALKGKADALYVCTDPFVTTNAVAINVAAAAAGLPTVHAFRDYVEMGGLASLGPDFRGMFASAAERVHDILRGATPAELSIKDETATELVINRATAKALGVKIPKGLKAKFI